MYVYMGTVYVLAQDKMIYSLILYSSSYLHAEEKRSKDTRYSSFVLITFIVPPSSCGKSPLHP